MSNDELSALIEKSEYSEQLQEFVAFIACTIFLIVYIILFYKLHRMNVRTSEWMMILPTLYVTIYSVRYLLEVISKQWYNNLFIETTLDSCFVVGNALFYIIMILRLKLGFKRTEYELSNFKLSICIIMLFIIIFINIFYYLVNRNGFNDKSLLKGITLNNLNKWNENDIDNVLFSILVCCNLVMTVFLVYLFMRNIVLMIIAQHSRISNMDRMNTLSEHQLNLLSIAIKYALLCSIAIIFTNIQFSGWILFNFGVFDNKPFDGIYYSMFWEWLFNVVLITNFICILLTFGKITKNGYQCLCSLCHQFCESFMESCIVKHIQQNHDNEMIKVRNMTPTPN